MCSTGQPGTAAVFKLAHRAAIKVQVHCESLGYDVERRFVILRDYACCTFAGILPLFLVLMTSSSLKELLQNCCRLCCFELLFGGGPGVLCSKSSANPHERRQESLKFGLYICRPQTRYIQYFDEGMDRSFVSAFGEKVAFFYTNTSSEN